MADTWKGLRRIASEIQDGNSYLESVAAEYDRYVGVLEREFLPLLEAAEHVCDVHGEKVINKLNAEVKRLREGQP